MSERPQIIAPHGFYVAAWPVLDLDRPMSALKAEASFLLETMLGDADVLALGEPTWEVRTDVPFPGCPDETALLVARVPAARTGCLVAA